MSFPLLRISQDCDHVEVRKGKGATGWNGLTEVFSGPAGAGDEWRGGEGEKLAACYRRPTGNSMSLPYIVAGVAGLNTGRPDLLIFPD
jgi:hypothetical protein